MKQDTKKTTSTSKSVGVVSDLRKEFEVVQATPLTRKVILRMESCCGCGCDDVDVRRIVPYDSPLQDGDRITDTIKGDKII